MYSKAFLRNARAERRASAFFVRFVEQVEVVSNVYIEYGVVKVRRAAGHQAFEEGNVFNFLGKAVVYVVCGSCS